jgi:hypothetical protein
MQKTLSSFLPLRRAAAAAIVVLLPACMGVSSLPHGAASSGTGAASSAGTGSSVGNPGTGAGTGVAGTGVSGTGTGTGGGSGTSGGAGTTPGVSIATVTPTTQLDSGRVTLRRLNIAEYDNTVRDLLGTTTTPAKSTFPPDDVTEGFDTLGAALNYSDLLGAQAETAAGNLVNELLGRKTGDPLLAKVLVCQPTTANLQACLTQILTPFMKSAFRRAVTAAEVATVVQLGMTIAGQTGSTPTTGLNAALKSVLLSPYFLFHVEQGSPSSTSPTPLSDYELASRLSYFLWSSMPDAQLTQAADASMLTQSPAMLSTQVDRMLADPKSQALTDNFAGQWLSIREVAGVSPDPTVFPTVDQALLNAIPQETAAFFKSLLTGAQPLNMLLLANYTFVNARLAKQYGITGIPTTQTTFTQASLTGTHRMGVLTQGTFLTTQSHPDRTSPVERGNWILTQLLCDPPPSPPPNVPILATPTAASGLSGRQALDAHATVPYCASCHTTIDPIGYTLENFDATGAYRTTDNGQPVDASGTLPDGTTFNGPTEIAQWVAKDQRYARCVSKQMLTYGVGRSFDAPDGLAYAAGLAAPLASTGTWTQLVHAVASSQAFLTNRGEGP